MCKLFAISNTSKLSRGVLGKALRIVNAMYGVTQRDGFGFSMQCGAERHTERYVDPSHYSGVGGLRSTLRSIDPFFTNGYEGMYESPEARIPGRTGPLIAHGRTSTGEVNLTNTHPFTKNGWTLAHNGVVGWRGEARALETTCDSEHLLNCYALGAGASDLKDLSGWAAWVAINPDGRLVAGRDTNTPLHISYCKKISGYIIATKKDDLLTFLEEMKWKASKPISLPDNSEITFDTHGVDVEGVEYGGLCKVVESYMFSKASTALGCTVGPATRSQVLGNQPSFAWENPYDKDDASLTEADITESIREWEGNNFHSHP